MTFGYVSDRIAVKATRLGALETVVVRRPSGSDEARYVSRRNSAPGA